MIQAGQVFVRSPGFGLHRAQGIPFGHHRPRIESADGVVGLSRELRRKTHSLENRGIGAFLEGIERAYVMTAGWMSPAQPSKYLNGSRFVIGSG